jgi:hypothetical protein
MISEENAQETHMVYKDYEIQLHRELMNISRKYLNNLSIVTIIGTLDYVKQELVELERATKKTLHDEKPPSDEIVL